ncbi:MAG: T9SS type A sorting domain-containing protein [Crocinitomicaceae bacterium]|nr:T9SS type A sorting domain-containing protein [Crocinitomicaceae bacterium]
MKYLVLLFLCSPLSFFCQISILSSDLAVPGDYIIRYQDTLVTYDEGLSGANVYWDFSNALNHVTVSTSVLDPVNTPYSANFPSSNLAMTNDSLSYIYLTKYPDSLISDGVAGDLLATGEILYSYFNPTLKTDEFPCSFGNNFSDYYAFESTADGSNINAFIDQIKLIHHGTVYDTVDAWGGISTPMGFYNAIRIKTVEYSTDTIMILPVFPPTWSTFQTTMDTSVSYTWLTKDSGLPIAEMRFDTTSNSDIFTWSSVPGANLEENFSSFIKIHPIPASSILNVSISQEHTIFPNSYTIMDISGKRICSKKISQNPSNFIEINIESFNNGVYILDLYNDDKIVFKKRFIKN